MKEGPCKAIVLCGPGNNGGDGFVIARHLAERGWSVDVSLFGGALCAGDAFVMQTRWREAGGEVWPLAVPVAEETYRRLRAFAGPRKTGQPVLVVDALFGTGLTRPLGVEGEVDDLPMLAVMLDDLWMDGGAETRFVAVDIPSGLCADSGRVLRHLAEGEIDHFDADPRFDAVVAQLTVTFHTPKLGHILADGPRMCGALRVVDIGLPVDPMERREVVEQTNAPWHGGLGKWRGHKFDHGHALMLAGGVGRGGAARLAARAALRVGAGLVTVGCAPAALIENAARLDAVMLRKVADGTALGAVLQEHRINALCLGPGLGLSAREEGMVAAALAAGVPAVLDADALTVLAGRGDLFGALHAACVLTPHGGEFGRMFPDLAERLTGPVAAGPAFSKVDAAREAAARAGCVVLFKGADTVIAGPDGRVWINAAVYERAAPWLATAGAGDVLAGIIAGLMARGFAPFDAACGGAWLHVEAAREFRAGLIAEDLPDMLPAVFRRLGL